MSELPSWSGSVVPNGPEGAGQPATDPAASPPTAPPGPPDEEPGRRSGLLLGLTLGLLGGLLLAAVGGGAYWLGSRQADDDIATTPADEVAGPGAADDGAADDGSTSPTVGPTDEPGVVEVDGTTDPGSDSDPDATPAADGLLLPPDGYVSSDPNYESRVEASVEYAVVRGGMVYLYGFTPTQESLDEAIAVTEGVMGPDGYVVERFVDPDAPEVESGAIFVDDKVLFAFDSVELEPDVLPILDLGVALMLQNPTAEMQIIARSDAVGPEDTNLRISEERGQAVVDYWVSKGVERSRMTVDARGEADASEDDSDEVAALNRSVEFVVSNIRADD